MVVDISVLIGTDMEVVEEDLPVFNPGKAIGQSCLAFTKRLYFGALKHDTDFDRFNDRKIVMCFLVSDYRRHLK